MSFVNVVSFRNLCKHALRLFGHTRNDHVSDIDPHLSIDAKALEELFPGSTVAWDHNPRIQTWADHHMRIQTVRATEDNPNMHLQLIACRRNADGQYVVVKAGPHRRIYNDGRIRYETLSWPERAVFAVDPPMWVVIR